MSEKRDPSIVVKCIERMRTLLLEREHQAESSATDVDLALKELKMDLNTVPDVKPEHSQEIIKALQAGHRSLMEEFFTRSFENTGQRLLFNTCLDLILHTAAKLLSKCDPYSKQYITILHARVETLQSIVLSLLKTESYNDLEASTNVLSQQIHTLKTATKGNTESHSKKIHHAEAVLQLCLFEIKVHQHEDPREDDIEYLYRAESICDSSFTHLQNHLSLRAYSVGFRCYKAQKYVLAVSYLREAFALTRSNSNNSHEAKILHLLGCAYLKWNKGEHWQKAVNALDMAIWHEPDNLSHLIKKLEALTCSSNLDALSELLHIILKRSKLDAQEALVIHHMLATNGLGEKASEFLHQAYASVSDKPGALPMLLKMFEIELQASRCDEAETIFQRILNYETEAAPDFKRVLGQLKDIVYHYSSRCIDCNDVAAAVRWLKNCKTLILRFDCLRGSDVSSELKLNDVQETLAYWQVDIGMLDEAKETLQHVDKNQQSMFTPYLLFKIAVQQDDAQAAKQEAETLMSLANSSSRSDSTFQEASIYILYACSYAIQSGKADFVRAILKTLTSPPQHDATLARMQLKCLQFITGLSLEDTENASVYEDMVDCVQKGLAIIHSCGELLNTEVCSQVAWFAGVAWNLALEPEVNPYLQFRLFQGCGSMLLAVCPEGKNVAKLDMQLNKYATMAAISGVRAAQSVDDNQLKLAILRDVQAIAAWYKSSFSACRGSQRTRHDPALLILQAELEAKIYSGCEDAMATLNEFLESLEVPMSMLQSLADVCQNAGSKHLALAQHLYEEILRRLETESGEKTLVVKNFRSLCEVLLESKQHDKLIHCVDKVIQFQQTCYKEYPEAELVWMMSKVWNAGLEWLMEENRERAKKYLQCGLRVAGCLPVYQPVYSAHMLAHYRKLFPTET